MKLSSVLAELQQHQFTAARLRALAEERRLRTELRKKLLDLALLLDQYECWLDQHQLEDANRLLDFAATALRRTNPGQVPCLAIAGFWLDGFAEMTPQEQDLLAAIVPFCQSATLAFCLENESAEPSS